MTKPKAQNEMTIFDVPKPPEEIPYGILLKGVPLGITQEMLDYYSIPIFNKDYMEQVDKIFNKEFPKSKCQSPKKLSL